VIGPRTVPSWDAEREDSFLAALKALSNERGIPEGWTGTEESTEPESLGNKVAGKVAADPGDEDEDEDEDEEDGEEDDAEEGEEGIKVQSLRENLHIVRPSPLET
jgi:hypothetical protein